MKYFGTDGIRQKADAFTPDFINSIIAGLATYADSLNLDHTPKVFVAGDTRESSEWILQDCCTALEACGLEYSSAGVLPTPAINYCFYEMGFDFAIDVTASHNPYTDNGIKIFERGETSGVKLGLEGCEFIETALANHATVPDATPTDRENVHAEAVELYSNHLMDYVISTDKNTVHATSVTGNSLSFAGLSIGIDCANGATSVIGDTLFKELGADAHLINADPAYGTKINAACGSTHLEQLQDLIVKNHLAFGVAFDGDGDRCLFVDHTGAVIDGDQTIAVLARYLALDSAAVTVMSNQGLLNWAADNHIHLAITDVGDTNVAIAMREQNIPLGGEQAGHIILPRQATGDGMLTALMITKIIAEENKTLHDLTAIMPQLPQVNLTLEADPQQKSALTSSDAVKSILAHFEENVKSNNHGRLLVRPSGTENLIRITVWGDDETAITKLAEELKNQLKEAL